MGLACVGGVCFSGLLTVSSVLPRHSRQYTCQTAGLGSSLALLFLTTTHHWVWLSALSSPEPTLMLSRSSSSKR